jgi:hypothetical protein
VEESRLSLAALGKDKIDRLFRPLARNRTAFVKQGERVHEPARPAGLEILKAIFPEPDPVIRAIFAPVVAVVFLFLNRPCGGERKLGLREFGAAGEGITLVEQAVEKSGNVGRREMRRL